VSPCLSPTHTHTHTHTHTQVFRHPAGLQKTSLQPLLHLAARRTPDWLATLVMHSQMSPLVATATPVGCLSLVVPLPADVTVPITVVSELAVSLRITCKHEHKQEVSTTDLTQVIFKSPLPTMRRVWQAGEDCEKDFGQNPPQLQLAPTFCKARAGRSVLFCSNTCGANHPPTEGGTAQLTWLPVSAMSSDPVPLESQATPWGAFSMGGSVNVLTSPVFTLRARITLLPVSAAINT
jgi:hypothetical protein